MAKKKAKRELDNTSREKVFRLITRIQQDMKRDLKFRKQVLEIAKGGTK